MDVDKDETVSQAALAREFPVLHQEVQGRCAAHGLTPPVGQYSWLLRIARGEKPILEEARRHGIDLNLIDNAIPQGIDRRPLYEAILSHWNDVDDPKVMEACARRLLEPGASRLLRSSRSRVMEVVLKWHPRLDQRETRLLAEQLAQCFGSVMLPSQVSMATEFIRDRELPLATRAAYASALGRFARKPGLARDALIELTGDPEVGRAAIWTLSASMKRDAVPMLHELRRSCSTPGALEVVNINLGKLESHPAEQRLPATTLGTMRRAGRVVSIEMDTDRLADLLEAVAIELGAVLNPLDKRGLVHSAQQLGTSRRRSHVIVLHRAGMAIRVGIALRAEDESTIQVEFVSDQSWSEAIHRAVADFAERSSSGKCGPRVMVFEGGGKQRPA